MAFITFTDADGTATLLCNFPAPADRFTNWTPMTRPFGDSVQRMSDGATVMFRLRTDYGASFELAGLPMRVGPTPAIPVLHTATSGGTLHAATYYYRLAAIFAGGDTTAAADASITTTGTTSTVTMDLPAVPGATGYRVYRGTVAGAETVGYTIALGATWVDDGTGGTIGFGPPPTVGATPAITADRLIAHLLNGGTCIVNTGDLFFNSYPTCSLYPGTTPSLRLTDKRNLEYTLSLQVLNTAGSPVRMDCVYL